MFGRLTFQITASALERTTPSTEDTIADTSRCQPHVGSIACRLPVRLRPGHKSSAAFQTISSADITVLAGFECTALTCQLSHKNDGSGHEVSYSSRVTHSTNTPISILERHSTACQLQPFCTWRNITTMQQLRQSQREKNVFAGAKHSTAQSQLQHTREDVSAFVLQFHGN